MHSFEQKMCEVVGQYGPFVARILIGGMFFMAGISKVLDFAGTVSYIESVALPMASLLAVLAILFEILGGLGILLGYKARYAADALIFFTLVATIFFHTNFADPVQQILFSKNLAIIGGLLYIMAYGSGPYSLKRKSPNKEKEVSEET